MLPSAYNISKLNIDPKNNPGARERTQLAIAKFRKAQLELERICKERGIPVPEMIC